jgi:N-methylhydantoinase A
VLVSAGGIETLEELERRFEAEHEAQYGHTMDDPVEIVHLRVRGNGTTEKPEISSEEPSTTSGPVGTRDAYCFARDETVAFSVYKRSDLGTDTEVAGPAIVQEPTTTIVIHSDQTATVDRYGNVIVSGGEKR